MNREVNMILQIMQRDSESHKTNEYFDALRQRNYEASFDGVKGFIQDNQVKLRPRRNKKLLRKWQWVMALLFPVLLILACTKTQHTELVGTTVSFSVPQNDDAAKAGIERLVHGMQSVITPSTARLGYLSYTSFIPAGNNPSVDGIVHQLRYVHGIMDLSIARVNAQVRESLLSQLGSKIFSTHIDSNELTDDEVQAALMKQLKKQGFDNISVTVTRDAKGLRTLELHPGKGGPNYRIDVSRDDTGTRMVLEQKKTTTAHNPPVAMAPPADFANMNDAQVRDYIRRHYGNDLRDEAIKVNRTAAEILIDIKRSDKQTEILRFKLR